MGKVERITPQKPISLYHKAITGVEPVALYPNKFRLLLECGHRPVVVGQETINKGVYLCRKCIDAARHRGHWTREENEERRQALWNGIDAAYALEPPHLEGKAWDEWYAKEKERELRERETIPMPHRVIDVDQPLKDKADSREENWSWLYDSLDSMPEGKALEIDTRPWMESRSDGWKEYSFSYYLDGVRNAIRRKYGKVLQWTLRDRNGFIYVMRRSDADTLYPPSSLRKSQADDPVARPPLQIVDTNTVFTPKPPTAKEIVDSINEKLDKIVGALPRDAG